MSDNTRDRIKDLEAIKYVLDKHDVKFFVVYGAALGFYRDKDFLPGDDDIDLAVVTPVSLETKLNIGFELYDLGFKPQPISFNVQGRMINGEIGYNGDEKTGIIVCERYFKFTLFFFYKEPCEKHGEEYVCIPKLGSVKLISSPAKFYEEPGLIKIGKTKYLVPHMPDYLEFTYFNNWKDKKDRRHGELYNIMHQ